MNFKVIPVNVACMDGVLYLRLYDIENTFI